MTVGLVGVGALAEAIVEGLCSAPEPPPILLSPRNARIARTLADRHANVRVCPDNQGVVDSCSVLVLTVRPDAVEDVLGGIRVPRDRVLVSAVAGWSLRALQQRLDAGPDVVRAIPLPAVRERRGVTVLFPGHPVAGGLFDRLGGTLAAPTEDAFDAFSAATATISSHLRYLAVVAGWLAGHGVEPAEAGRYVRSMFLGALDGDDLDLAGPSRAHETPGGTNEELRATWFTPRNQAALEAALDRILERVSTRRP